MDQNSTPIAQKLANEIVNRLKGITSPDNLKQNKAETPEQVSNAQASEQLAKHHFANTTQDISEKVLASEAIQTIEHNNHNQQKIVAEHLPKNSIVMANADDYDIGQLAQNVASDYQPNFSQANETQQQNVSQNDNEAFDRNSNAVYARFHPNYDPIDYASPTLKSYAAIATPTDSPSQGADNSDNSNNNNIATALDKTPSNPSNANSGQSGNDGNSGGNGNNNGGDHGGDHGGGDDGHHSTPTASLHGDSKVDEGGYANYTIEIENNDGNAHQVKVVVTPGSSNTSDIDTETQYYDPTTQKWVDVPEDGTVPIGEGQDTVDIRVKTGDDSDDPVNDDNSYTVTIEDAGDDDLDIDGDDTVTTTIADENDPPPIVALDGKLFINEIGLHCSPEVTQTIGNKQFHVDAGQSYIEIKNISAGPTIPGYAIEQLIFEIVGPNGQKQQITMDSMSGDSNAHQLGANETLVIYSNGTWAIYNANGELRDANSFGTYTSADWHFGNSTSDALGINLVQLANDGFPNEKTFCLDQFLANNVDSRLFDFQYDGWNGAEQRGIADTNGSSSYYFASLLVQNNPSLMTDPSTFHDQFRGLVGDQDHTLQLLGLNKPGDESNSSNTQDGESTVFSRDFGPQDQQGNMDNNTENNWSTSNHPTPGTWNNYADDFNPQDPNDNLNPEQNNNQNAANAGQTIIDDSLDGNTSDNNIIFGGQGDDYLYGDSGNDVLNGQENNDLLFGGRGNDQLYGGSGADLLVDISGQDILEGDSGDDILIADPSVFSLTSNDTEGDILIGDTVADWRNYNSATVGSDVIFADETSDIIFGDTLLVDDLQAYQNDPAYYLKHHFGENSWQENTDLIEAQHHLGKNDWISGGGGNDLIFGQGGNDYIDGGDGNDVIFGGDGDDTILGGSGNNWLFGNDGNDHIISDGGGDMIKGGKGDDTISLHTSGEEGRNILYYDDVLDGNDTVEGFRNGDKPNDQINLDALFDKLGIADNERADKVLFKQIDPNTVEMTIAGVDNFSITFTNSENNDAKSFSVGNEYTNDILVSNVSTG